MSWCHIYYITSVILYIYSEYATASEYYVSAAPNGKSCPYTDLPCHNLSYYTADNASYFTDDAIFYFLEGTHTLQGILYISNVSNITLQGLGHIEQGFHETVMQSTTVIRCSDSNRTGILFTSSSDILLKSLTIANCEFNWHQYYSVSLYFVNIKNVTLEYVSVQNSSGDGLFLLNAYDVLIANSSFANNGALETFVGNVYIIYNDKINRLSRVNIFKSNFTLGLGSGIHLRYGNDNEAEINIENSMFSNNIAQYGGGVSIILFGGGSIEFNNCTICNNTAQYGGALYIDSFENSSIHLDNCTLYNNTAWYGGGMDISSYVNGNIQLDNCTLYNNTAAWYGGGMFINLYGNSSIDLGKCTLYNNTAAQYGGGMDITLHGNGSIDLSNCDLYKNTAQVFGGGMGIFSLGSGTIEFINCTVYDNVALLAGGVDIVLHEDGSIEFSNCTIFKNTAAHYGGGLYIDSYGNGTIDLNNCTLYNNTAWYGGGMYINISLYANGSIDLSNCNLYNNTALVFGGAMGMFSLGGGSIEFINCTVYDNVALLAGGVDIVLHGGGSIEFSNCTIFKNTAAHYGGGLYIDSYGNGTIDLNNCTLYNNTAWYGGGMYINISLYANGSIDLSNCNLYNNTALVFGGAMGMFSLGSGTIEFINCTVYDNVALLAGGVDIVLHGGGSIEFSNCTICKNTAAHYGGGLYIDSYGNGTIDLNNCTLYNNTAQYGGGMYINISLYANDSIDLSNCNLYNNTALVFGGAMGMFSLGSGTIEFINCTVYDNVALLAGGVDIVLHGGGSIEISNSTICKNTAAHYGGGLFFDSYGNSSIDLDNCTLYNNTAQSGGGMYISSYGNGSIDLGNCILYNNTARYGGGMYMNISSYGNGSIDLSNCDLYSNTAQILGGGARIFSLGGGNIEFINCSVYDNIAPFAGAVDIVLHGDGSIEFSNCTICKNTAHYGGGLYIDSYGNSSIDLGNCTLYNNTASYGGGMDINSYGNSSIDLGNCTLYNNAAQYGGGMHISLYGNDSIDISNCDLYNNTAQVNGGGVRMYSSGGGNIELINCIIYYNTAQLYGGGVFISSSAENGSIVFSNCTISNNSAYFALGLVLHSVQPTSPLTSGFHFANVSFHFNKVINNPNLRQKIYQSAVVVVNVNNVTFDQLEVSNHNTTGLVAENSLITFDGHNIIGNNTGIYGGGIALYKSSQLLVNQNTNVSFINNHASKSGGGIFVSQVFDKNSTNNCTFKVIPHHDPNDTKTVLYFVNNTADISGDVLYGGKIDDCTSTLYFDHLFHYPQQTGLSVVTSDPIQVCFCESNRQNCSITNVSIFTTSRIININVSLATVGILDGLTQGMIKLSTTDNSSIVQNNNNRLKTTCTNVIFTLITNTSLKTTQVYATLESSNTEPLYDPYAKVIEVTIEPCPNGFPLVNGKCACRPELNSDSITCDTNTQSITRDGDMWIGYENNSHCLIVYSNCPFHYCNDSSITFTLNYTKKQCLHNRSGVLCGQCSEEFSLTLGYNQCEQCTNDNVALIIPFALAGIALVAFIIVLNLTVSVGTINGLIFYANIVKIYEPIFFPKHTVNFLSQFISWINLDLGIKTCFYHSMDSCSKMWLQFVFPAYVWFIVIFIIILLRYSSRVVRLVGRQAIPVLATMILLSYTKLIRTVFHVLYSTKIPCTDDKNNTVLLLRWYIDPNVQYARGCHIPLFLFSLAVLILLIVPYTFYLLTIPLFEGPLSKYMCCCQKFSTYMKPFFDAYGGPYKDRRRFWTGFLLLIRLILALVLSLDTEATKSLDVLTSLLMVIMFMHYISKGIYRHFPLDYLEEFFILNLMFMAYMNVQTSNDNDNSKGQLSSIVLVSISFVVFCGIIFYHVWDCLIKSSLQQPMTKVRNIFKKPPPSSSSNDLELSLINPQPRERKFTMSLVTLERKRESTLFDTDD